jgi:hypothetical protein
MHAKLLANIAAAIVIGLITGAAVPAAASTPQASATTVPSRLHQGTGIVRIEGHVEHAEWCQLEVVSAPNRTGVRLDGPEGCADGYTPMWAALCNTSHRPVTVKLALTAYGLNYRRQATAVMSVRLGRYEGWCAE